MIEGSQENHTTNETGSKWMKGGTILHVKMKKIAINVLSLFLAVLMMTVLFVTNALAYSLTYTDDFTELDEMEICVSGFDWTTADFSTTNSSYFKLYDPETTFYYKTDSSDSYTNRYAVCVKLDTGTHYGSTDAALSVSGSYTLTFYNCGFDADGDDVDCTITVSNVEVYYSEACAEDVKYVSSTYSIEGAYATSRYMYAGSYLKTLRDSTATSYQSGIRELTQDVTVSFTKHSDESDASGTTIFSPCDMDVLGTLTYDGTNYCKEFVTLKSGLSSKVYIGTDTTLSVSKTNSANDTYIANINDDTDTYLTYSGIAVMTTGNSYSFSMGTHGGGISIFNNFGHNGTHTVKASAGSGGSISDSGSTTVYWKHDQSYEITPDEGYYVSGVTVDGDAIDLSSYDVYEGFTYTFKDVIEAHTIVASFSPITYTIKYNANGGSGTSPSSQSATYDKNVTLADNPYTAPSEIYVFTSWNTKADGSGKDYDAGGTYSNLTSTNGGTVTLYAQWGKRTAQYEYVSTDCWYDTDTGLYSDYGTVSEIPTDDDGEYVSASELFDRTLTDSNGDAVYTGYWMKLDDGTWVYTFYVYDASIDYYVYEEDLTGVEGFEGDYTILDPYYIEDGSVIAEITNSDGSTGNLSVNKKVVATDGTNFDSTDTFKIKITLYDEDENKLSGTVKYGDYTFTDGVLTYMIADDETITIEGIPEGYTYKVQEVLDDVQEGYYTLTTSGSLTGVIVADSTKKAYLTNKGDITGFGGLKITKVVTDSDGNETDDDTSFKVTVTITDENGETLSGTQEYGGYEFTKGVASFTIKNGVTITIDDIPIGYKYSVKETSNADYTTSYSKNTGTISDEIAYVTVTNKQTTSDYGSFTVTKYVKYTDTDEEDTTDTTDFKINVVITKADGSALSGLVKYGDGFFKNGVLYGNYKLSTGESLAFTDIPEGYLYTVTEVLTSSQGDTYTVSYSGASGSVSSSKVNEVEITNYKSGTPDEPYGILTLTKKVSGARDSDDGLYKFYVTFSNSTYTSMGTYIQYYDEDGNLITPQYEDNPSTVTLSSGTASIVLYLADGESAQFLYLLEDTYYQIAEEGGDYISSYVITSDDEEVESDANTVSEKTLSTQKNELGEDDSVEITYTNTIKRYVDVKVTKISQDEDGNEDTNDDTSYSFTADFLDLEASASYAYTIDDTSEYFYSDSDGVASVTFELKNGETCTFSDLPVGCLYQITEAGNDKLASYTVTDAAGGDQIAEDAETADTTHIDFSTCYEEAQEDEEITITFINRSYTADVQVVKYSANNGEILGGAVYSLYQVVGEVDSAGTVDTDDSDNSTSEDDESDEEDILVMSGITTEEDETSETYGYSETITLSPGTYYFVETKAPENYELDGTFYLEEEEITTFTITDEDVGTVVLVSNEDECTVAYVRICKVNTDGTLLGGAEFELYADDDTLIEQYIATEDDTSSEDYGYSEWLELEVGSYYFIENESPSGYFLIGQKVSFEVTEDDLGLTVTVTAKDNRLLILASTGGVGIFLLILVSAAAIAVGVIASKRKKVRAL